MVTGVMMWDEAFLVMAEADTVGVARRPLAAGTRIALDGAEHALAVDVPTGHKVARRAIAVGETILRWGAPIGSATTDIPPCAHVHLHNMKSDYIATYRMGETTHGHDGHSEEGSA